MQSRSFPIVWMVPALVWSGCFVAWAVCASPPVDWANMFLPHVTVEVRGMH